MLDKRNKPRWKKGLIFISDPEGHFTHGQIQLAQGGILIMLHQLFQWTEGVPKTAKTRQKEAVQVLTQYTLTLSDIVYVKYIFIIFQWCFIIIRITYLKDHITFIKKN